MLTVGFGRGRLGEAFGVGLVALTPPVCFWTDPGSCRPGLGIWLLCTHPHRSPDRFHFPRSGPAASSSAFHPIPLSPFKGLRAIHAAALFNLVLDEWRAWSPRRLPLSGRQLEACREQVWMLAYCFSCFSQSGSYIY